VVAATVALFLMVPAFGCSGSAPTSLTVAAPTLTGLNIAGAPDLMLVGETAALTVSGTWSDGASRAATVQWATDAPGVLAVDNGTLTGRGAGVATVTATSGSATGTARVRVVPNLGGVWTGSYRFLSCSVPPRWGAQFCPAANITSTMTMDLAQQRDGVVGTLAVGRSGTVRGSIATDGTLALTGRLSFTYTGGTTLVLDLRDWQTVATPSGELRGRWSEVITWVGESGQELAEIEIIRVTKR
jgi:hypothetical protein